MNLQLTVLVLTIIGLAGMGFMLAVDVFVMKRGYRAHDALAVVLLAMNVVFASSHQETRRISWHTNRFIRGLAYSVPAVFGILADMRRSLGATPPGALPPQVRTQGHPSASPAK
jgi:hypothetical protein